MRDPKLAHILVENDSLDELNQMPLSKKFYLFRKLVKTQNSGQNRIYPSLTLLTAKFFPLKTPFFSNEVQRALYKLVHVGHIHF